MEPLEQLDSSKLSDLFQGSTTNLIPESLINTITIGFIVINILGVLFLVFYIVSVIRKWKVESAILQMQKDVAEIKSQLVTSKPVKEQKNESTD